MFSSGKSQDEQATTLASWAGSLWGSIADAPKQGELSVRTLGTTGQVMLTSTELLDQFQGAVSANTTALQAQALEFKKQGGDILDSFSQGIEDEACLSSSFERFNEWKKQQDQLLAEQIGACDKTAFLNFKTTLSRQADGEKINVISILYLKKHKLLKNLQVQLEEVGSEIGKLEKMQGLYSSGAYKEISSEELRRSMLAKITLIQGEISTYEQSRADSEEPLHSFDTLIYKEVTALKQTLKKQLKQNETKKLKQNGR